MSDSPIRSQPRNYNLLSSTGFNFMIKKLPNVNFFTESINIPGKKIYHTDQVTPLVNIPLWGNKLLYNDLTVTFKVDEDFHNYEEISMWLDGLGQPSSIAQRYPLDTKERIGEGKLSDCIITITTNVKNSNMRFILRDAFPISISDIVFSSTQSNEEHIIATAIFKYMDMKLERV